MKLSIKKSFMFVLTILALTFSSIGVTPAYAATLTVTNTTDSGPGSLRAAIANAGVGDTIIFAAGLSGGTIYLASTLTLSKNVTIDGSALALQITISGDTDNNGTGNVRVFLVNSGVTATLNSLIITKGDGGFYDFGAGINNFGTLTITNCILSDNSADYGGGIYNEEDGTLTVTDSTLSGNSSTYDGGAINSYRGTLTITNSTFSGNSADYGGGIYNEEGGALTIANSTLSGNSASYGGGGIYNNNGTLTVTNTTLSGNSGPSGRGGGIENSGGTLTVTNSTLYDNQANSGGGIGNSGTLTVTNSTLSNNSASSVGGEGGGIYNYNGTLTVTNSAFSGNSAYSGGGIYNDIGTLTVTNSTLSGNSAAYNNGGGISNYNGTLTVTSSTLSGNSAYNGGGIANSYGTLTVTNSTFSNNFANLGGGISNYGTLTVTNSTLSGNSVTYHGGGIYNDGILTVTNSTLSGNSATHNGGGIFNWGTLNYANTIIANSSSGGDCFNYDTIGTNTNNLVEDGSCSASLSGDPKLGALANNGGSTQTLALLTGSSAIDAGDNTICAAAPVNNLDQRGVIRPYGAACDIGSYELDPTAKDITAFSFISPSAASVITGTNIAVTVPFGTNPNGLVATFTTTGASVAVGVTPQVSGTTTNNFTSPVTYRVTAADASTKDYIVTVTVAANPAKAITAFSFTSPAATGVITGTDIAVTVPFGTNVTALVATFTTTGASVAVGATPQVSGTTTNNFTSPVTYRVTAADASTKDYIVTVTVAANPAKDITAFSFTSPAATSVITGTNIALTVPFGTNVTALVATFTTTGASVAVGATTQVNGTTANNFTSPVTYRVTAADASTKDYIVTVTVAPATVYNLFLPLILR